jgi:predicted acetyltransferase
MVISKGATYQIDDRFMIHVATDQENEFEEVLKFNISIHEDTIREYLEDIFFRHPKRKDIYWVYIKDSHIDQIISSIALLPLEWRMGDLSIPICEMGFVGTAEYFRGRGFIRELNRIYEKIMVQKGYVFSVIRGIPYFYRKLGYVFSFPLDNRFILPESKTPSASPGEDHLIIQDATFKDFDFIKEKYEDYHQSFFFRNAFWEESFKFKYLNSTISELMAKTYIIEEKGKKVGYFTLGMAYDWMGYKIRTSALTTEQAVKILQFVKKYHDDNDKNEKRELDFDLQGDSILSNLILELGGYQYNDYGWQVKIPNIEQFLLKIKSLLEERLHNSRFKSLSRIVTLSNYLNTFKIQFEDGKFIKAQTVKEYLGELSCDIQIPDPFLSKLLLGDKSFEEIKYIIKDAMIKRDSTSLISVLFPKKPSFPETYY